MLDALKNIFDVTPRSNSNLFKTEFKKALEIPEGDKRRKEIRERMMTRLENLFFAIEAVETTEQKRNDNYANSDALKREAAIAEAHAVFSNAGTTFKGLLPLWKLLDAIVLIRPSGSKDPGRHGVDLPLTGSESYVRQISHHIIIAGPIADMKRLVSLHGLPNTLTWQTNGNEVRVYYIGNQMFTRLDGKRLAITTMFFNDNTEQHRHVFTGAKWITPPEDALPEGSIHLPELPPVVIAILTAHTGMASVNLVESALLGE